MHTHTFLYQVGASGERLFAFLAENFVPLVEQFLFPLPTYLPTPLLSFPAVGTSRKPCSFKMESLISLITFLVDVLKHILTIVQCCDQLYGAVWGEGV